LNKNAIAWEILKQYCSIKTAYVGDRSLAEVAAKMGFSKWLEEPVKLSTTGQGFFPYSNSEAQFTDLFDLQTSKMNDDSFPAKP
jgi:hypothetical protein